MLTTKRKWIAVAVFAAFVLLCTLLSIFKIPKNSSFAYESVAQFEGRTISGVSAKMPTASAKIFLDSYFGVSFGSYSPCDDFITALAALDNKKVSAIWVADVTADYYCRTGNYRSISPEETAGKGSERLQFAFAFRPEDTALRDIANELLDGLEADGTLDRLYDYYVNGVESSCLCPEFDNDGKTIYVGITGTVPPLEMVDAEGNVSGMAVELSKYLANYVGLNVKFVVLDNETAFARLMNGRVDMIACYGTSENHSTEFPEYIMSRGYCSMLEYRLLVTK